LRAAIADYEVVEELGLGLYLAKLPERRAGGVDAGEPSTPRGDVILTEVPVGSAGWAELTSLLTRFASVGSSRLLSLIEVGPDLDSAGAGAYLVTETAPGGTLASPARPLTVADQVQAVAGAALGAHDLHESGIAHGDINPGRIFLTDRGAVLGPPISAAPPGRVAAFRDWHDLALVDPDLLRGEPPSRSSDVWALAAALYSLLGPAPLYPNMVDDQPVTAVQRVLFSRPEVGASAPADLAPIFGWCFDPDPGCRPQTALELAERLRDSEAAR